jgi:hypothetical protein
MTTKKDRKTLKRDGVPSSGSEGQRLLEIDACQRLLEAGSIGARYYQGPHLVGAFQTRQDRILTEMKWLAVDVYQQKKLAVAHCRTLSNMITKYWTERKRGSLEDAASMIQSYWVSVSKEIRAPLPQNFKQASLFRLNTLQSLRQGGSPRASSFSVPHSLLTTPTATALNNGFATPPNVLEDNMVGVIPENKKLLAHGLVRDWLNERSNADPPSAEGTTGLADFCVQVIKHHLREEHSHQPRSLQPQVSNGSSQSPMSPPESPKLTPFTVDTLFDEYLIPIDSYLPPEQSLGDRNAYRDVTHLAIESAIQSNVGKHGVDGLRCSESLFDSKFNNHRLLDPSAVETHRTVLQEILCTNIMSRNPQLFCMASNLSISLDADGHKKQSTQGGSLVDARRRRSGPSSDEQPNGSSALVHKHYYVSVIFSTFSPVEWEPVEDILLRDSMRSLLSPVDWDLVANVVNTRMRIWLGYDLMRTGLQCRERWRVMQPTLDSVPVREDGSKKKKVASNEFPTEFVSIGLSVRRRRIRHSKWSCELVDSTKSSGSSVEEDSLEIENPYVKGNGPPSSCCINFERRGVFSVSRPPTNFHNRGLFHHPKHNTREAIMTGALFSGPTIRNVWSSQRQTLPRDVVPAVTYDLATMLLIGREPSTSSALCHVAMVDEARAEEIEYSRAVAIKLMTARNRAEPPKRAFSVEDMIRKNAAANPGQVPSYISGQQVCPQHPSFANLGRIAEMTLNRLVQSIHGEGASNQQVSLTTQVPMPIETLFGHCSQFRKKYPAVFTNQHKVTKPSMPQLRPTQIPNQQSKMMTRQQATTSTSSAPLVQRPQPVVAQSSSVPSATTSIPATPTESVAPVPQAPVAAAGPGASWLRTRQRRSTAPSRGTNSPSEEATPDPGFMAAGGPSLYGQFNHRQRGNR